MAESARERDESSEASDRPRLSDLVLKAHALEDTPGVPVEDPERIKTLLDA